MAGQAWRGGIRLVEVRRDMAGEACSGPVWLGRFRLGKV